MRLSHPQSEYGKKIVVILGAGFAGLNASKSFAGKKDVHVILVDQKNHHLFQPLLYQVASAGLNPADIAAPIRSQFRDVANVEVYLSKVEYVDLAQKFISVGDLELNFDFIILACGAQHSYFNHPEWEEFAPGLKTVEQAIEIRRRILIAFEKAESAIDPEEQKALLTFIIIGGGPTGVELAGSIAEISRTVLIKDFKRIKPQSAGVVVVERGVRVLSGFDPRLSDQAADDLKKIGVVVRTSSVATNVTAEGVTIGDEFVPARTVLWAAGVQATRITCTPTVRTDPAGRIVVNQDFSVPDFPYAFVVGDMAHFEHKPGELLPGLAPVALQGGRYAARAIQNHLRFVPTKPFRYFDRGMMATIGKNKAVAQVWILRFHGFIAWALWLVIHIMYLIGFRNRVAVLLQWAWTYLLSKRGARLITEREWKI